MWRENFQTNKVRNEKEDVIIDIEEIHRLLRKYFKNMYFNMLENLKVEWIIFLLHAAF